MYVSLESEIAAVMPAKRLPKGDLVMLDFSNSSFYPVQLSGHYSHKTTRKHSPPTLQGVLFFLEN